MEVKSDSETIDLQAFVMGVEDVFDARKSKISRGIAPCVFEITLDDMFHIWFFSGDMRSAQMVPRKMAKAECREKPVLEPGKSYYLFTDIEPWNETVRNMLYALGATTCAYPKSLSRMRPGYIMNDKEKGGGIGFLYFHV